MNKRIQKRLELNKSKQVYQKKKSGTVVEIRKDKTKGEEFSNMRVRKGWIILIILIWKWQKQSIENMCLQKERPEITHWFGVNTGGKIWTNIKNKDEDRERDWILVKNRISVV